MEQTPQTEAIIREIPEHFRLHLPHRVADVVERVLRGDINKATGSPESISAIIADIIAEERRNARTNRRVTGVDYGRGGDYTVAVEMSKDADGVYTVENVEVIEETPAADDSIGEAWSQGTAAMRELREARADLDADFGSAARAAEIMKEIFGPDVEPGDLASPGDYQDAGE